MRNFIVRGRQQCSPSGTRQAAPADKYCSITAGTWLTQKDAGQQCSHNFECRTNTCIEGKCLSQDKVDKILKIVRNDACEIAKC